MLQTASNVALLAPIPWIYLPEGQLLCELQGKAAFGSRAWEVFRELDAHRHGLPAEVYIYASHANPPSNLEASWHAIYIGHVDSQGGAHPEGMKFRPPSTSTHPNDNQGWWAVFWDSQISMRFPKRSAFGSQTSRAMANVARMNVGLFLRDRYWSTIDGDATRLEATSVFLNQHSPALLDRTRVATSRHTDDASKNI